MFDRPEWAETRAELADLLGRDGLLAAARTTLNAHYTDPTLVASLWQSVESFGVTGGVVLEPGCGAGGILDAAGPSWRGLGVELDPTTAKVAAARLDGRHEVIASDFAAFPLTPGRAAAVVGNVPFGQIKLFDPVHNPDRRLSIHDHFLAKSAAALAPGGVAAVITSRYTLDSRSDAGRRAIGEHADFLGAIRLPDVAHEAFAGTRVVTDIVVLRGRAPDQPAHHAPGFLAPTVALDEAGEVRMSAYFDQRPEQVLGAVGIRSSQFGPQLTIDAPRSDWHQGLDQAVSRITRGAPVAPAPSLGGNPLDLRGVDPAAAQQLAPVGRIERTDTGVFRRRGMDGWEPYPPGRNAAELTELVALRDGAEALVAAETDPQCPETLVEEHRVALARRYDAYVTRFGALNRSSLDKAGRRRTPRLGGFRKDPSWPRVAALEIYDDDANVAAPAALLNHRVLVPAEVPTSAADPADAVAISLQQRGRLDRDYVADLLEIDPADVQAQLQDLAYADPLDPDRLIPAAEYLSGNVRQKLAAAQAAAENDQERWGRNVEALAAVQPRDVTADELDGLLGAPWIPIETVNEFAHELAGLGRHDGQIIELQHSASLGRWDVEAPGWLRRGLGADHPFGTEGKNALQLLKAGLNGTEPIVWKTVDEARVVDAEATEAARERLRELREHFDHWMLRDDPDRAARHLTIYNERFNSLVPRDYSGLRVAAPGLRQDFKLRPHQHAAIGRMIHGGNTLLAHPVGAGKTAEMIVGAMELRRTGAINRPAFVVPNHMLEQFSRDIVDLYPGAQVLAISKDDLNPRGRAEFAARARSHDWDAVVITHRSYQSWPLEPAIRKRLIEAEIEEYRADRLSVASTGDGRTLTKRIENQIANHEERLKKIEADVASGQDSHDLYFNQAGIDYLCVDEAHTYKNIGIVSSAGQLRGVPAGKPSLIAEDLRQKLDWLREAHPGQPTVAFATGTPITNTVAEMWAMGRHLRPELLHELRINTFDAFRQQFCQTSTAMELDPSGTKLRQVARLARYQNLPELARWWGEFADVVQVEDLNLPRPQLAGGVRRVITIEPDPDLVDFMEIDVADRAEAIRGGQVEPQDDNMLKLTSDCRMASFDWAGFSEGEIDDEHSTLAACANKVAALYHENKHRTYRTAAGDPHPRTGAMQLVFADLGTPKADEPDTAYARLKSMLIDRGIPAEQVQFAHDHDKSDDAKARFFASCRDGRVAVAISSTPKMGVGTNVQDRLLALHHLDCPWRPSDIEQREGRILRQGNQNDQVEIYAYATERSFSVYGWQTLERKAGFIGQVMRARPDGPRSIEVADDEALSYGEVKALATGDPDFIAAAEAAEEVARLERLARSHGRDVRSAQTRVAHSEQRLERLTKDIEVLTPLAEQISSLDPDKPWALRVNGEIHTNRADATRSIQDMVGFRSEPRIVADIPDTKVQVRYSFDRRDNSARYELVDPTGRGWSGLGRTLVDNRYSTAEHVSALSRVHRNAMRVPDLLDQRHTEHAQATEQLAAARVTAETPFPHRQALAEARTRSTEIAARLEERYGDPPAEPHDPTPAPTTTGHQAPSPEALTRRGLANPTRPRTPATPNRPYDHRNPSFGR